MLGACRVIEGDPAGEVIYYGIACRMAQLLNLPYRQCGSHLEREINIRGDFESIAFSHTQPFSFLGSMAYVMYDR